MVIDSDLNGKLIYWNLLKATAITAYEMQNVHKKSFSVFKQIHFLFAIILAGLLYT